MAGVELFAKGAATFSGVQGGSYRWEGSLFAMFKTGLFRSNWLVCIGCLSDWVRSGLDFWSIVLGLLQLLDFFSLTKDT